MKLMINISEEDYETAKKVEALYGEWRNDVTSRSLKAIANGIPLPKGHGKIIDESQITEVYTQTTEARYFNKVFSIPPRIVISGTNAPTIVEADKAESEEG